MSPPRRPMGAAGARRGGTGTPAATRSGCVAGWLNRPPTTVGSCTGSSRHTAASRRWSSQPRSALVGALRGGSGSDEAGELGVRPPEGCRRGRGLLVRRRVPTGVAGAVRPSSGPLCARPAMAGDAPGPAAAADRGDRRRPATIALRSRDGVAAWRRTGACRSQRRLRHGAGDRRPGACRGAGRPRRARGRRPGARRPGRSRRSAGVRCQAGRATDQREPVRGRRPARPVALGVRLAAAAAAVEVSRPQPPDRRLVGRRRHSRGRRHERRPAHGRLRRRPRSRRAGRARRGRAAAVGGPPPAAARRGAPVRIVRRRPFPAARRLVVEAGSRRACVQPWSARPRLRRRPRIAQGGLRGRRCGRRRDRCRSRRRGRRHGPRWQRTRRACPGGAAARPAHRRSARPVARSGSRNRVGGADHPRDRGSSRSRTRRLATVRCGALAGSRPDDRHARRRRKARARRQDASLAAANLRGRESACPCRWRGRAAALAG